MGKKSKAGKTDQPLETKEAGEEAGFEIVEDEQRDSGSDGEWVSAGNKVPASTGQTPITRSQAKKGKKDKVEVTIEEEKKPESEPKGKKQTKKPEEEKKAKDKADKKKDDVW